MVRDDILANIETKYREQFDLYSQVHNLCVEHQCASDQGDMIRALEMLEHKKQLLHHITELESEIQILRRKLSKGNQGDSSSRPL